ncbi:YopX family protein [Paenibacillus glucanolyticus]|uniref:YopX family protein n=1 Tax=Paenibacillus glucanolyticus TaxID=59843 RepID=UPI0035DE03E1
MKMRAFYRPLEQMLEPDHIESINFDTKVLGVYMEMDGKGYHKLRMSDFEIMWYTGLKDRNGKEIYEGDILDGSWVNPMSKEKIVRFYKVVYEKAVFYAQLIGHHPYGTTLLYFENKNSEVAGNICNNPEMYEGVYE